MSLCEARNQKGALTYILDKLGCKESLKFTFLFLMYYDEVLLILNK